MKISILDLFGSPRLSLQLVQEADLLGYHRYWIGEHHGSGQCANPLIACAVAGGLTETIRIGTGAVGLALRSPFHVAEDARILAELYGDRFDLGVTKGNGAAISPALSRVLLEGRAPTALPDYPSKLIELHRYLEAKDLPDRLADSMNLQEAGPPLWVLGLGVSSAILAGELGAGFCSSYHHGGTRASIRSSFAAYRAAFVPGRHFPAPATIVVIGGACADDEVELGRMRQIMERSWTSRPVPGGLPATDPMTYFLGRADACVAQIQEAALAVAADEVMILTPTPELFNYETNHQMYRSLAAAWGPHPG